MEKRDQLQVDTRQPRRRHARPTCRPYYKHTLGSLVIKTIGVRAADAGADATEGPAETVLVLEA